MESSRSASKRFIHVICVCIFAVIINATVVAQSRQYVTWSSIVNGTNLGNGSVHKTSTGTWDFSAVATQTLLAGDGYVESTAANYNQSMSLSGTDGVARSLVIGSGGWAGIYENNVEIAATSGHPPSATISAHAAGDRCRLEITNGTLRYIRYRSGAREVLFTSTAAVPAYPLSFSLGMSPQNAEWQKSVIAQLTRKSTWSSITNGTDLGNGSVRKTSTGSWDFSANAAQTLLRGDGYFESTASYYNQSISVGGTDGAWGAIVVGTGGWAAIYENNIEVASTYGHPPNETIGIHAAGDRYRLEVINGKLSYVRYRGGVRTPMFTSANPLPVYPLSFGLGASFQNSEWQNSVFAQISQTISWSSIVNGTDLGNGSARKTSTGSWDFSASVAQQLSYGSGYVESTASYYDQSFYVGGSDGLWGAIVVGTGGWAAIYENNVEVAGTSGHDPSSTIGAHAAGDRYRLEISRGKLRYARYRAGVRTLMFTSANPLPAYPLGFGFGASFQNSEWQNTIISDNVPEYNEAALVSQTISTTMVPGQSYNASVTMRNTGASTWTPDGDYQLASENLPDNQTWGLNRVNLASPVVPGSDAVFNFAVTAPSTPGAYHFQWRMVQQGVQRFDALTNDVIVQTVNNPPSVSLTAPANNTSFTAGSTVALTASASDSDGTVSKVEFFQGSVKLGEDTTAPYSFNWTNVPAGAYTLTARATDNSGAIATSAGINITVIVPNQPPVANPGGPYSGTTLTAIQFNGGGSSDSDGIISSYQWSFGDNNSGTGATPTHAYATAGTYTVTLTVTDNSGATNTATTTATIANRPPVANPGGPYSSTTGTPVQFNGSSSSDQDGTIATYSWNFGDNTSGTGATPTHTYATANTYTITLTVTDNNGATDTATTTATIANRPPVANAGGPYSGTTLTAIQFNGGGSSDPDGNITAYAWNFGDNGSGTGAAPTHTYATSGTFTTTLTVTDNNGATNSATATVTVTGFSDVRLDPLNQTGDGGENPLSRNFNWSMPLVGLSGRGGLDLGLSLSYNSLATWTKKGGYISFDDDQGFPAPGFRLGFPIIQPAFYNSQAGKSSFLLITTSGGRVELRQVGSSNLYQAVDSSYLLLDTSNNQMKLRSTDGSQLSYASNGSNYVCTEIKDRNGNFITVNYDGLGRIDTIIDTLARSIKFNYTGSDLVSITQTWTISGQAQPHTWASFTYANKTVQTSFSNLTVVGPQNGSTIRALTKVTFPDNSHYDFDYTSWGQVWKISQYVMDNALSDHLLNYRSYNLRGSPTLSTGTETDCPRFTERHDWAENWNRDVSGTAQEAITYFVAPTSAAIPGINQTGMLAQVISAAGTPQEVSQKIYFGSTTTTPGWQNGLPLLTETYDSNAVKQRWVTTEWEQDLNVGYPLNPRAKETNIYDPAGNHARTRTEYAAYNLADGTTVNLPQNSYQYQADATTVLGRSHVDYHMDAIVDAAYLNRRILGLVKERKLYQVDAGVETLMSRIGLEYDENGSIQGADTPAQHDNTDYGTGFLAGRGNMSSVNRYDVINSGQLTTNSMQYNTTGSVIKIYDGGNHLTQVSYADAFSANGTSLDSGLPSTLAYPTTVTDPDGYTVKRRYDYDFGAITWKQTPLPNTTDNLPGPQQVSLYDSLGRLERMKNLFNDAYTRYIYGPNYVETFSTVNNVADEAHALQVFDGHGRVIAKASNHPGSDGGFSGQLLVYDQLGRVMKSSNPTETSVTITGAPITPYGWAAAGDDAQAGWVYTQQTYDWKGRPLQTINPSTTNNPNETTTREANYSGCGCAGGEVATLTDEGTMVNGETKRRQQKIYSDVLGRPWKAETLNWDGTVYSTSVSVFNARDQLTNALQYAGVAPAEASSTNAGVSCPSGTCQKTTMSYDGYGRLQTKHVPEQQADPNNGASTDYTTWTYNNDDTTHSVIDARGASATYTYNNGRGLMNVVTYSAPAGITPTANVSFVYDAAGNRTSMNDGLGTVSYNYNLLSHLMSETRQFADPTTPYLNASFMISYNYNLAGQVTSVGDPFGSTVVYSHDQIGQLTSVDGSGGGAATYASGIKYRAFGGLKHLDYGNSLKLDLLYNDRLLNKQFDITNSGGSRVAGWQYQYGNDGQLNYSHDLRDDRLDRAYKYDHAGNLWQGLSGSEARGNFSYPFSGPYMQTYGLDVWGNLTNRSMRVHGFNGFPTTSSYYDNYVNNRNVGGDSQPWVYDADGRLTNDRTRQYSFDAAGYEIGNSQNAIYRSFDGDGEMLKKVENGAVIYYLRSSVLGETITELNQSGQKQRGYVYRDGEILAKQEGGSVVWNQEDSSGTSSQWTNASGGVSSRVETDPLQTQVDENGGFSGGGFSSNPIGFYGNANNQGAGCAAGSAGVACGFNFPMSLAWRSALTFGLQINNWTTSTSYRTRAQISRVSSTVTAVGSAPSFNLTGGSYQIHLSRVPVTTTTRQTSYVFLPGLFGGAGPFGPGNPGGPAPPPKTPCAVNTQLPASGTGYIGKSVTSRKRQYGTSSTIASMQNLATSWTALNLGSRLFEASNARISVALDLTITIQFPPGAPFPSLRVGEIGISGGGQFGEHKGADHAAGNGVDIGLFRTDGKNLGGDYHNPAYDQRTTQHFANLLDSDPNVVDYYFNDLKVTGTKLKRVAGHDNHIHVNFTPCVQ